MTEPVLKYEVSKTLYESGVTRKGSPCFIVSYHTVSDEVIRQWLFPGKSLAEWWKERSPTKPPSDMDEAADMASRGRVKPTRAVHFVRDGRWSKVVGTDVGEFPKEFAEFMRDVQYIFGEVEVIRVVA